MLKATIDYQELWQLRMAAAELDTIHDLLDCVCVHPNTDQIYIAGLDEQKVDGSQATLADSVYRILQELDKHLTIQAQGAAK